MKQKTIVNIAIALAVLFLLALAGRYGFTVVKIEDSQQAAESEAFDPVKYVDGIWASALIPSFDEAVDLHQILSEVEVSEKGSASKENLLAIANKYGLITEGEALVFKVKGTGKIVQVNQSSMGTVEVALDGYDGPIKVLIFIGDRIPPDNTSVRDAVGFMKIGDFPNQVPYGQVSSEINMRIIRDVVGTLDKDNLVGKTVSFKGAFSIPTFNQIVIQAKEVKIAPVIFTLGE